MFVFCVVRQCRLVGRYQYIQEIYHLHLQDLKMETVQFSKMLVIYLQVYGKTNDTFTAMRTSNLSQDNWSLGYAIFLNCCQTTCHTWTTNTELL
jgi:hypothetical protein